MSLVGAQFRLANDQFTELLTALTSITTKVNTLDTELNALELRVDQAEEDIDSKPNYVGEIFVPLGEIDGVPSEFGGVYTITDLP